MNPIFVEDQQTTPPTHTAIRTSNTALSPSESSSTLPEDQSLNFTTEDDDEEEEDVEDGGNHLKGNCEAIGSTQKEQAIERRAGSPPNALEEAGSAGGDAGGNDEESLPRFMTVFTVSRGANMYATNPARTPSSDQPTMTSSTTKEKTGRGGRGKSNGGAGVKSRRLARGNTSGSSFARSSSSTNTSIELQGTKASPKTPSRTSQTSSKSDSVLTEPSTTETDLSLLPSGDSDKAISDTSDSERRTKREVSFKAGTLDNEGNDRKQKYYKKQPSQAKTNNHVHAKTKGGHHHRNNHTKSNSSDSTSVGLDIEEITEDQENVPKSHNNGVSGSGSRGGRGPPGKTKVISDSIEIEDETMEHLSKNKDRKHPKTHHKDQRPNMSDSPKRPKHSSADHKSGRKHKVKRHKEVKLANDNYETMIKGVVQRTRRKRMCQMFVIFAVSLTFLGIAAFVAVYFSLKLGGNKSGPKNTVTTTEAPV